MKRINQAFDVDHSGLDSFLDIITNVIGVLILIGATIAVQVMNVTVRMNAPIVRSVPGNLTAVEFHCGANRVLKADYQKTIWDETIIPLANDRYPNGCNYWQILEMTEGKTFGKPEIESQFVKANNGFLLKTKILPNQFRGSLEDLKGGQSEFEKELDGMDPAAQYLFFFVANDSFEVFHKAREIAVAKGFRVGVEIMDGDELWTGIYTYGGFGTQKTLND